MSQPSDGSTAGPAAICKSCDNCARRKVRCNKALPCGHCARTHTQCIYSPRRQKPRKKRVNAQAQVTEKVIAIDRRLEQIDRIVNGLVGVTEARSTVEEASPRPSDSTSRSPGQSLLRRAQRGETVSSLHSRTQRLCSAHTRPDTLSEITVGGSQTTGLEDEASQLEVEAEGSSSLAAHSNFAANFLKRAANWSEGDESSGGARGLLDTVKQVVGTIEQEHRLPDSRLPARTIAPLPARQDRDLPPFEVAVGVIRKARAESNVVFEYFDKLLPSTSLAELCMNVYFSDDYDESEFIIVNSMLYSLFEDSNDSSSHQGQDGEQLREYRSCCALNIEKALAALSLFVNRSHTMALALVLGAIYAMEISKPSLAWTLVISAQEISHALGSHKRQRGTDNGWDVPNHAGLLFWVIYFLEKTLSLRLGRTSTISDADITVPLPGGNQTPACPALAYFQLHVKLAGLAGKIYTELYSAQSLTEVTESRQEKVQALSREAREIQEVAALNYSLFPLLKSYASRKDYFDFVCASDKVLHLSILALIHRASPPAPGTAQPFTDECIMYAREALKQYNALNTIKSPFYYNFMVWTLLLTPFIPFFVLFCHVVQTNDRDDLECLEKFVHSIGAASGHYVLADHHRLLGAFLAAAQYHVDRKGREGRAHHHEDSELEQRMESYLMTLGQYPRPDLDGNFSPGDPGGQEGSHGARQAFWAQSAPANEPGVVYPLQDIISQPPDLNWFTMDQQTLDLLDMSQQ